jgi:mannose-1-phosphate guanylyltransferase
MIESPDIVFTRVDANTFSKCKDDSIDYAVMEKTDRAAVVALEAGWSDVGSWTSLWETEAKNDNSNVTVGGTILENINNNYVNAEQRLVSFIGLDGVVVVETKDAVMVAYKDDTQSIKNSVSKLKTERRP